MQGRTRQPKGFIRTAVLLVLGCLLTINSSLAAAHADHDKARFVSSSGVDSGKCDDVTKPCKTITYAGLQSTRAIPYVWLREITKLKMSTRFFIF